MCQYRLAFEVIASVEDRPSDTGRKADLLGWVSKTVASKTPLLPA